MKLLRLDQSYPIAVLKTYDRNPRRGDVDFIKGLLTEHGQHRTVVVRLETGEVLAGNQVLLAARDLGWTILAASLIECTDDEARAIVLSDNRASERGGWDAGLLAELLQEASAAGQLEAVGYDDAFLNDLLNQGGPRRGLTDPDDVPDAPGTPITERGGLWVLGEHRLLCGDATVGGDVDRLMDGTLADLLWTDPPYGVGYVGGTKDALTESPTGTTVKRIAPELLTPKLLLGIERLWPEAVEDLRLSEEMARDHPEHGMGERDEVAESGVVFAAYASDQLVGGAVVTSGAWIPVSFLERVTVARPWRRRGIGLALATRVAEWARNQGKRMLVATIWVQNDAALALALRVGFQSRPVGLMVRKFREPRISEAR